MYSYGPPLMTEKKQDDQLEHTYSSYVKIRDVVQKTRRRRMNDREKWREWVRDIRAGGTTWWWCNIIMSCRSSGLHPVSSHSCWMYVRVGRPAFARPYVGVHRSTSLMSSSLLLQQCPACLVRLTWIVFVMGDRWLYNWCFVGCCRQDLFNIARSILV